MNDKTKINGNIQGMLRLLDEVNTALEDLWNGSEIILTKGEVGGFIAAKQEIDKKLEILLEFIAKFEKLAH